LPHHTPEPAFRLKQLHRRVFFSQTQSAARNDGDWAAMARGWLAGSLKGDNMRVVRTAALGVILLGLIAACTLAIREFTMDSYMQRKSALYRATHDFDAWRHVRLMHPDQIAANVREK
jgi:hypothetical protein